VIKVVGREVNSLQFCTELHNGNKTLEVGSIINSLLSRVRVRTAGAFLRFPRCRSHSTLHTEWNSVRARTVYRLQYLVEAAEFTGHRNKAGNSYSSLPPRGCCLTDRLSNLVKRSTGKVIPLQARCGPEDG